MSIFEEWSNRKNQSSVAAGSTSQMFEVRKLEWQSTLTGHVLCKFASSNNVLIAATTSCSLLRWNLDANTMEDIEISRKPDDFIEQIYLDPSGHHAIICMRNADNYYLHSRSTRPKKLSRLPGGAIESIAFDRQLGGETATRTFLVGTKLGNVYEMAVDSGGKERVCQMIYQLDKPLAITSIHFETIGSAGGDTCDTRIFVLLATSSPTRLYNFFGGPAFQQLFAEYTVQGASSFTELPGDIPRAELTCFSKTHEVRAQMFALMSKEGIYHGKLLANMQSTSENILMEAHLTPYASVEEVPMSIAATEFHFLSLSIDRIQFTSRLNGSVVQEEVLRVGDGNPLGLVRDIAKGITWMYTDSAVFQITTLNEDMNIWKIYLDKAVSGDERYFETSLEHCKRKDEQAEVLRSQAEFYLSKGDAEKAALYFARSGAPFEQVILRLLNTSKSGSEISLAVTDGPELSALRVYLQEELKILPVNSKSQRTMICTWLCEIFLHQISSASFAGSVGGNGDLLSQFKDFIRSNRAVLDTATTLSLMTSRGQGQHRALLLFYAQMIGDYDRVIAHYLSEQRYSDVINLLTEAPFDQVESLIYKCAPVLIQYEPESTVQLLSLKQDLRVQGVLPALLRYESLLEIQNSQPSDTAGERAFLDRDFQGNKTNFAIVYLQDHLSNIEANDNTPSAVIYHTLAWLLAKYDADEEQLTMFLQQIYDKQAAGLLQVADFNAEFVLRQCKRFNRNRAAVNAFLLLGMEREAVQSALAIDIEIAKAVAQKPSDDLKKKELWILIAKHVIAVDKDAKRALMLLPESNEVLKIDDLLPMLPDFTEIELFKEEICHTLEDCGARIDHLKMEMEELSESAESISLELESMKKRGYSASANQRCEYCTDAIFTTQFYLFPCSHGFHSDCLMKRVFSHNHLDVANLAIVRNLEEQLRIASLRAKDNDKRALAQQEYLQNEIDGYIAADCPLCGYVMIQSLSMPLISENDSSEVLAWRL